MNIYFYNNYEERIKVTKTLADPVIRQGTLREGCSITAPSILIEKSDLNVFSYNYAKIPEFNNRYYFIDDIVSENAHLWRITMSVDVLMSYQTGIRGLTCMVARSEDSTIYDVSQDNKIFYTHYDKEVSEHNVTGNDYFNVYGTASQYLLTYYTNSITALGYDTANPTLPSRSNPLFNTHINISKLGNTASAHTSIIKNSNSVNDGNISTLALAVADQSNLASFIASCMVFPFNVEPMIDSSSQEVSYTLLLGDGTASYGSTDTIAYEPKYQACPVLNLADFTLTGSNGNFLDYDPYTTYELYLPYKGWITLDPNICLGNEIKVDYTCELTSGVGLVQVYTTGGKLIYEGECQLGVSIPFSVTDNQERTANIMTSVVSSTLGIVASALIGL